MSSFLFLFVHYSSFCSDLGSVDGCGDMFFFRFCHLIRPQMATRACRLSTIFYHFESGELFNMCSPRTSSFVEHIPHHLLSAIEDNSWALFAVMAPRKAVILCTLCLSVIFFVHVTQYFVTFSGHTKAMMKYPTSASQQSSFGTPKRVNALATDYDSHLNVSLQEAITTRAKPQDPRVVNLARKFLDPPSDHIIKLARRVIKTPQAEAVLKILNGKVR